MTHKISRAVVAAAAAAAMLVTPGVTMPAQAAPLPAADTVVAKPGSTGATVKRVQVHLRELGFYKNLAVDGVYGPKTAEAVKAFQKANRLAVTGVVTSSDFKVLDAKGMAAYRARVAAKKAPAKSTVVAKRGDKGKTVQQIQGRLQGIGYLQRNQITGTFGPATASAVQKFQKNNKLPVTGVVDTRTSNLIIQKYKNRKAPAKPVSNTVVAKKGDRNKTVQQIQGRLAGLGYLTMDQVIGVYGPATTSAVQRFQKDSKLPVTGVVDTRTSNLIIQKYKAVLKAPRKATAKLDRRCLTGRAVCIDKGDRKMYWVVNGSVKATYKVRTGRPNLATRSGAFQVYLKHPNWYSTLYHVNMPYTMFFSGGQAIHYSAEFARIGYAGAGSHGCVNMNSMSDAKWLYSQVRVGDKVIVTN